MRNGPDQVRARELYRRHAATYDRTGWITSPLRRRAVSLLGLRPGDMVLDVGCGTGLSFSLIEEGIGVEGRLIGIELSPEMVAVARDRVERRGWTNVTLVNAPAEEAEIPVMADAAFSFLTHDVMRTPAAIEKVVRHLKTGGRVSVFGGKWARLLFPLNPFVWLMGSPYVTTFEGLWRPWSHLERWVPDLRVRPTLLGCAYYAWGRVRGA